MVVQRAHRRYGTMHWGHILVALSAMAASKLDKVVFVIAGSDPRKPSMTSEETRHHLGRSVIEMFHPLFAYSPLALGTDLDGETNLGRLLKLNSHQPAPALLRRLCVRHSAPAGFED